MHDINRLLPATPKGWQYELVYKNIRHIYFRIYPDKRTVRISAPARISSKALEGAIQAKSAWLINRMNALSNAPAPFNPLSAIKDSGSCMIWGRQLPVIRGTFNSRPGICLTTESEIIIRVPSGFDAIKEENLWNQWLRSLLNERIQTLLERWQPAMGVAPVEFRLKKMKTRWGSCNTLARRIWLNTVLVHLEPCLLECVVVHELAHLLEPGHTQRFYQIMETYLPDWKAKESLLNKIELRQ
ncbi:M48 family metallopeptidase [Desulfobacter curvatus]|uniref:M48 family metallopeptidase n=1 Tax=Desulfobacter curvatus TaxID=2290 RepID=UPI00035E9808|nr:SprT family zinc-dependent metalloprotease [Desulfobacter curvatus]